MTRRTLNADGTITLSSFYFWGNGDADEALKNELTAIERINLKARSQWDSLTPKEREQRTLDFETKRKARETLMAAALEIPSHVLTEKKQEPPNPGALASADCSGVSGA